MHAETTTADVMDDGYAALARVVPLRLLRSTVEHDRAIAQLNALIDRHSELSMGEIDYMDVLGLIVAHYEDSLYGEPAEEPSDDVAGQE